MIALSPHRQSSTARRDLAVFDFELNLTRWRVLARWPDLTRGLSVRWDSRGLGSHGLARKSDDIRYYVEGV